MVKRYDGIQINKIKKKANLSYQKINDCRLLNFTHKSTQD